MRLVLVTGTGTSIGKTVVTASLASAASHAGASVAVVKPVQTGVRPGEPGDADEVRRLTGLRDVRELARFDEPLAPATAARRLGVPGPSMAELVEPILGLHDRGLVLVEGAGGALVRLNTAGDTLIDLGLALNAQLGQGDSLELVLVVSSGLGTLHATAATAQAVRHAGLTVDHLVVGDWPVEPDLAQRSNLDDLPDYAQAPISGVMRAGMGGAEPSAFAELARLGLAPALGGSCDAAEFARLASRP